MYTADTSDGPVKGNVGAIQQAQSSVTIQPAKSEISPHMQTYGYAVVVVMVLFALAFYWLRFRKFAADYAALSARIDGHFGTRPEGGPSPGHTYAVASRGPSHARDAEMQSAEARWRHLSMAFPHLDDRGEKRPLILVSVPYTDVAEVNVVQELLAGRIAGHVRAGERAMVKPAWIQELGNDFDALRHPQLAIANPAIYTFPFFLTWQRRHQWGVLPYAVHNRLGVICHPEHPKRQELLAIEKEYAEALDQAKRERTALWVNDPKHARWLPLLLSAAGSTPSSIHRVPGEPLARQHTSPTVFSVGAYLHKEILPLMCAVLPDSQAGSAYAAYARELEVSDLSDGLRPEKLDEWPKSSVIVADLAVLPAAWAGLGWSVLRLPHCVYVPIGIGYSVATVPLLLEHSAWRNDLLRDAGETLTPAAAALSNLGIELDERLWTADRDDGS